MTKKTKKFNPEWPSAQADTPAARAARQRDRRARLKTFAQDRGFGSIEALETALLNGEWIMMKAGQPAKEQG